MSMSSQRVVVIQDASKEISLSAIIKTKDSLLLKPGDKLTLLGVLHQVNTPSTLSFVAAGKLLGYKSRVDSTSMFAANSKVIEEEVTRKKEEYKKNLLLEKISNFYAKHKIEFGIEVIAGSPPRLVSIQASRNLRATWIILDRQMKKDKKYFMEKLSCGISRMKRDNSIEQLRGPQPINYTEGSQITYDEMLPGSPDADLFSLEISPPRSPYHSKSIKDKEKGVVSGEGTSWSDSHKMTSISKSNSSEHLLLMKTVSSSSLENAEASSSNYDEAKTSPLHLQEEDNNINTESRATETGYPASIAGNQETSHMQQGSRTETQDQEQNESSGTEQAFEIPFCSVCKNRRPKTGCKKDFTYAELQAATDGFSSTNFLSEGGFGSVYKGLLIDGHEIAVKQLKDKSLQGEKEFKSEVNVLSKARHENVVMLLGSCSEGSHRLLVYEYVCNGSLDQHLSKNQDIPLSWENRMKIALGASKGLNYLHENNIIHRDMRPNNILVTHDHEPLLGDFGLARTQHEESDHSSETRVVGTFGYLAPEYAESGKVSTKTDVYSFGVILLQLITGLRTTDKKLGEKSLVGWARPLLKERKYPDLIDNKILDSHDVHQLFWMVRVAQKCISKDPDKRLAMRKVVDALTYITSGETVSGIEDFLPIRSDAFSNLTESNAPQAEEGTVEHENSDTDASSISSTSQISTSSAHTVSASSEKSFSGNEMNNKKEKSKSRIRNQVHYGEMLL